MPRLPSQLFLRGYPCDKIRCQTTSFCSAFINTQSATSVTVRPQPRQISSKVVEHTATQGVSGRSFVSLMIHTIQRNSACLYRTRRSRHIQKKKIKDRHAPIRGVIVTLIMLYRSGAKVLFPAKPPAGSRFD